MSNAKQETIADIVAWLRRPREGENAYLTLWRDEIADRIEAAENQSVTNCNRLGNAAALRESLEKVRFYLPHFLQYMRLHREDSEAGGYYESILEIVNAAIFSPPRNCDRPECATTNKAQKVWLKEDGGKTAYYEWLLETSTAKGGAK